MAAEDPGQGGTAGDGDGVPSIPDAIWRKFLDDTEQAIRASAPRELSARERGTRGRRNPAGLEGARQEHQWDVADPQLVSMSPLGEVWEPEEPWPGPAWRDMDGPARRRRVGRFLAAIAAVAVAVGALSHVPTRSGAPGGAPSDATSQQSDEVLPDEVPTGSGMHSGPAYTGTPPSVPRTG